MCECLGQFMSGVAFPKKEVCAALAWRLSWLERIQCTKELWVLSPVRVHTWVTVRPFDQALGQMFDQEYLKRNMALCVGR